MSMERPEHQKRILAEAAEQAGCAVDVTARWGGPVSLQNHRITGWFGLEGTSKGCPDQPPAMSRGFFNQIRLLRALSVTVEH